MQTVDEITFSNNSHSRHNASHNGFFTHGRGFPFLEIVHNLFCKLRMINH